MIAAFCITHIAGFIGTNESFHTSCFLSLSSSFASTDYRKNEEVYIPFIF
jgi:hypothetical protein